MSTIEAPVAPGRGAATGRAPRIARVYRAERRKLAAQTPVRLLALACVLGPLAFAGLLSSQSGAPTDSLFGVWVHTSGFAIALVVLSFAGAWGVPVLAGVLAGDMFSSEDRHGTWAMVLTRSCRRGDLFAGKALAAATFLIALIILAAASSLAAGLVFTGAQPLVGLSGQVLSPGTCAALVIVSWLVTLMPALGFMSLALLFSIASRNGIVGVIATLLVALAMQLLALVGAGVWVHVLLLGAAFDAWHGLWTEQRYFGPVAVAAVVSAVWIAVCLTAAWVILRRRDFAGVPSSRPGWGRPLALAVGSIAVVAVLAVSAGWGPVGVTTARLQGSLGPAFDQLTLLQQRQLGRVVPRGFKLRLLTSCNRRAGVSQGPGDDWICTVQVFTPAATGPTPFQSTAVTYDVSVKANGCYKADAPPAFIGQQWMRSPGGQRIVNPLFTIYGCFNVL